MQKNRAPGAPYSPDQPGNPAQFSYDDLNGGTEAVTRVLIESQDEAGESWTTVGVSPNIIDASFQALMDSIFYKLVKSGAPA